MPLQFYFDEAAVDDELARENRMRDIYRGEGQKRWGAQEDLAAQRFSGSREAQMQGMGYYQDMIEGKGPSLAEQQMQRGIEQSSAAQAQMAAQGRGGNLGATQRQAGMAGTTLAAQGNMDAAMIRSQEQQAAMAGYAGMANQMAGQDLQAQMGYGQMGLSQQQLDDAYALESRAQTEQEHMNRWNRFRDVWRGIGKAAGSMMQMGGMMSDERAKADPSRMSTDDLQRELQARMGAPVDAQQERFVAMQAPQTDARRHEYEVQRERNRRAFEEAEAMRRYQQDQQMRREGIGQARANQARMDVMYPSDERLKTDVSQGGYQFEGPFARRRERVAERQAWDRRQEQVAQGYEEPSLNASMMEANQRWLEGYGRRRDEAIRDFDDRSAMYDLKDPGALPPVSDREYVGPSGFAAGETGPATEYSRPMRDTPRPSQREEYRGYAPEDPELALQGMDQEGQAMFQAGSALGGVMPSDVRMKTGYTMSDVRSKTGYGSDERLKTDAREAAGELKPYSYRYKDPEKWGEGRRVGVMAQDLAKTPAGRETIVPIDTPEGQRMGVDVEKGTSLSLAINADQEERLRRMESAMGLDPDELQSRQAGNEPRRLDVDDTPSLQEQLDAQEYALRDAVLQPEYRIRESERQMLPEYRIRESERQMLHRSEPRKGMYQSVMGGLQDAGRRLVEPRRGPGQTEAPQKGWWDFRTEQIERRKSGDPTIRRKAPLDYEPGYYSAMGGGMQRVPEGEAPPSFAEQQRVQRAKDPERTKEKGGEDTDTDIEEVKKFLKQRLLMNTINDRVSKGGALSVVTPPAADPRDKKEQEFMAKRYKQGQTAQEMPDPIWLARASELEDALQRGGGKLRYEDVADKEKWLGEMPKDVNDYVDGLADQNVDELYRLYAEEIGKD